MKIEMLYDLIQRMKRHELSYHEKRLEGIFLSQPYIAVQIIPAIKCTIFMSRWDSKNNVYDYHVTEIRYSRGCNTVPPINIMKISEQIESNFLLFIYLGIWRNWRSRCPGCKRWINLSGGCCTALLLPVVRSHTLGSPLGRYGSDMTVVVQTSLLVIWDRDTSEDVHWKFRCSTVSVRWLKVSVVMQDNVAGAVGFCF
jgi:hypothetical protein